MLVHGQVTIIFVVSVCLWSPYVIGQTIIFSSCSFFLMAALCNRGAIIFLLCDFYFLLSSSFFFPRLISAATDWISTILLHMACPSANLECRSEMCCARLAANAGRKKSPKSRHLGTIAQLCRAISSQLRHVSTIG